LSAKLLARDRSNFVVLANTANDAHANPTGEIPVLALAKATLAPYAIPECLPTPAEHLLADPTISPLAILNKVFGCFLCHSISPALESRRGRSISFLC
jgi:hypothetical protein